MKSLFLQLFPLLPLYQEKRLVRKQDKKQIQQHLKQDCLSQLVKLMVLTLKSSVTHPQDTAGV
jgi:hypothetical protein